MTTKILKVIEEFEAVRAKATQGEWKRGCTQEKHEVINSSGDFESTYYATGPAIDVSGDDGYQKVINDAQFIAEAANRVTQFTAALKVAVEALEMIRQVSTEEAHDDSINALTEIERLLEHQ